jgi:hypothetical protein
MNNLNKGSMKCTKFPAGAYTETRGNREDTLCNSFVETHSNKITKNNQFNLTRPAFRSGGIMYGNMNVPMLKNKRTGDGNKNMERNNFIAPPIKGREQLDFEKLQLQEKELQSNRNEIQLGDKTIEKLFKVQIQDPTDIAWINEYNARISAGETAEQLAQMPPLGRPQRQVSQMRNFGQQGLKTDDKLELLSASILQSGMANGPAMANLVASTAQILNDVTALGNFTQQQFNQLKTIISRLNVPKDYRVYGFTHKVFTWDQYKLEQGFINLYILSNLGAGRSFNEPLVSVQGDLSTLPMTINSMVSAMQRQGTRTKYLNVADKTVITQARLYTALNAGEDGGKLNGRDMPQNGWR